MDALCYTIEARTSKIGTHVLIEERGSHLSPELRNATVVPSLRVERLSIKYQVSNPQAVPVFGHFFPAGFSAPSCKSGLVPHIPTTQLIRSDSRKQDFGLEGIVVKLAGKADFMQSLSCGLLSGLGVCGSACMMLAGVLCVGVCFGFVCRFARCFVTRFVTRFEAVFSFGYGFCSDSDSHFGLRARFEITFVLVSIFVLCRSYRFALIFLLTWLRIHRVARALDWSLESIQAFSTTRGLVGFFRLYSAVFRCTRRQHFAHICILHPSSRLLPQLRVLHLSAGELEALLDCVCAPAACSFGASSSSSSSCLVCSVHCKHRPIPRDRNQ